MASHDQAASRCLNVGTAPKRGHPLLLSWLGFEVARGAKFLKAGGMARCISLVCSGRGRALHVSDEVCF